MADDPKHRAYDPALSDVLGGEGEPVTVTAGNTVWKIGHPVQRAKDRYEKYLLEYERALVLSQKAILPQDDYQERVDKLAEQIQQRQFSTGGLLWLKHSLKPVGWLMWVRSLLAEHHPAVTQQDVEELVKAEPDQVRLALEVVVPPFVAWVVTLTKPLLAGDPAKLADLERAAAELDRYRGRLTPTG